MAARAGAKQMHARTISVQLQPEIGWTKGPWQRTSGAAAVRGMGTKWDVQERCGEEAGPG